MFFNMDTSQSETQSTQDILQNVGCVIIGRNEGKRLQKAIDSIPEKLLSRSIYVDSGSTDGSLDLAIRKGLHVIQLDSNLPFTAARARNTGAFELIKLCPHVEYIQFFDGDCLLEPQWLEMAIGYLKDHKQVAIVCGQRKELHPGRSIYNWLCDIEWDTPVGKADFCGGDFCIRTNSFKEIGGFNQSLIAGEEPDLCFRIRMMGESIYRINHIMTWHDANIINLKQWYQRTKRAGYAYAEAVYRYIRHPQGYWRKELLSILSWGMIFPITIIMGSISNPLYIALVLIYPLQIIRISLKARLNKNRFIYGTFMMIAKFAQLHGVFRFFLVKFLKQRNRLIEYK
ncbi:MAG TPA: glycosyltransferase family 2 protein [Gammaproteobacteria bacterium]|nr:glycosyltransferase family 2 protein [Gammaproteobacteria bacterium]